VLLRSGVLSGGLSIKTPVLATVGLGVFFVVHSLFVSSVPDVSILKAVSWVMVTATLISAWSQMRAEERHKLFEQLYYGLVLIMVISLPLVALPLGYLRNGSGFQGVLNHPQAFGPTMAILGALAGSRLLSRRRPLWSDLAVFGICLLLILLSEARTAGVALIFGLAIGFVAVPWLSKRRITNIAPGLKSRRLWGIIGVALILGLVFSPFISQKVSGYIVKSGRAGDVETLAGAYEQSRGGLIARLVVNIVENPVTGIGFGIASNPLEMVVERDPVFGLPVSAAIEKGVLPLAVIEELGFPGAFLVFLWFWMIVKRASLGGFAPLALTTTALLLNMGENIFFSPGGMGGLLIIFVSWACTDHIGAKILKKTEYS
jgi:hypothetical protein